MKYFRVLIISMILTLQVSCSEFEPQSMELRGDTVTLPLVGRLGKINYQGLQLDVKVIINKGSASQSSHSMENLVINNTGISGELKLDLNDGDYVFDIEYILENGPTTAIVATIATYSATITKDAVNSVILNTATLEYPDTDSDSVDNLDEMLAQQDPNLFNPVDTVYYTLQSIFSAELNECFEANAIVNSVPEGPARTATCDDTNPRQSWKFVATSTPGYYKLLTQFTESQETVSSKYCLEGNEPVPQASVNGYSHITNCGTPASGQLWKTVYFEPGLFTLVTIGQENRNLCLESSRSDSGLDAAAFMSDCLPYSGQVWIPLPR